MRTKNQLLYDISIDTITNECGTHLIISMNVRDSNVKETLHILFNFLKKFCHVNIDNTLIESGKKKVKYINN